VSPLDRPILISIKIMERPLWSSNGIADRSLAPSKSVVSKKGLKLEPRSPGFVFRSNKCKTSDAIRTFLSEYDERLPKEEVKPSRRRAFSETSKHFKRMLQIHSKPEEASKLPVTYQRTSDGRKYGQIYNVGIDISTYNVNNIQGTISAKGSRKGKPSFNRFSKENENERTNGLKAKELKKLTTENGAQQPKEQDKLVNRQLDEFIDIQDPNTKSMASWLIGKRVTTPTEQGSKIPKPYIETPPAIPLSPMKVFLEDDVELSQDWLNQLTSQNQSTDRTTSRLPTRESEDWPIARDFANDGAARFQRFRAGQRRSRSPEDEQDTVAGMSHNYIGYPSFRQRIEDLQASHVKKEPHLPKIPALGPPEIPPNPPSSPITLTTSPKISLKPSPLPNSTSNPPSLISASPAAEEHRSHTSSGIVSNAQSAMSMRGQIASKPPMPGPAPTRALPSLPESHDDIAPTASESSQRIETTGHSPVKIHPWQKKHEYSFFPSSNSPPKANGAISPVRTSETIDPAQVTSPSSSSSSSKIRSRPPQAVSVPPLEHTCNGKSVNALDQWQQQRVERTAARKARDLARVVTPKAMVWEGDAMASEAVKQAQDVHALPRNTDSNASSVSGLMNQPPGPQNNQPSTGIPPQNGESSTPSSRKISPVIVVAEQSPTPPPPTRLLSPSPHLSSHLPNDLSPSPSPFPHPSLPTTTRAPTPHTHSLLRRAASNRSSTHRASVHEGLIGELEARLVAMERKNVLLERAFMAVVDAGAGMRGEQGIGNGFGGVSDEGGGRAERGVDGGLWNGCEGGGRGIGAEGLCGGVESFFGGAC